jgi:hypothetical protein
MKRFLIVVLPALAALFLWAALALAQSNAYLLPYGMSAGMQVLNLATRPKPAVAPTPVAPEAGAYGAQPGDRRLVCEQWTGQRWAVIQIPAKQCNP